MSTTQDAIDQVRGWADSSRAQAAAIRYFGALADDPAKTEELDADADKLDANADGWDDIATAAAAANPSLP